MGCINSTKLPFSSVINIPRGFHYPKYFYYNDDDKFSFAVSTENLNLYLVENSFPTDEVKNPCTDNIINGLEVIVKEVRMSGTLYYRLALNALDSSYNFLPVTQDNVNEDGWSSADGSIAIELIEGLTKQEYIVVGYLDPDETTVPTREDVTVVIESFDVQVIEEDIIKVTGEVSFIVKM